MYIYKYIYMYLNIYIYIHLSISIYLSIYLSLSLSLYIYIYVYIYIYIYMYIRVPRSWVLAGLVPLKVVNPEPRAPKVVDPLLTHGADLFAIDHNGRIAGGGCVHV